MTMPNRVREPHTLRIFTYALCALVLIVASLLVSHTETAFAKDTVELDMTWTSPKPGDVRDIRNHDRGIREDGTQAHGPNDLYAWYVALNFTENVSWARDGDDAFVKHNCSLVSLQYADGTPVETTKVIPGGDRTQRVVLYIYLTEVLEPLTSYRVVVEPGITSIDGKVSTERYVIPFRTSDIIDDSTGRHSVYVDYFVKYGIPVLAALMVAGGIAQVVRYRRSRRV